MNATLIRPQDGALSDSLAGLLGHLQKRYSSHLYGTPQEALCGDADRFVGRLAEHLRYAEELLFPALLQIEPGTAGALEGLKEDHRFLHLCARDLALEIRRGDKVKAHAVGRSFLAVLLEHIHRESEAVDRIVRSLDALDARRLSSALVGRPPDSPP